MSLLTIIQDAALELGLRNVSSVVGSSDLLIQQLKALADEEVRDLSDNFVWPQLSKEYTFTLVDGQANYDLPDDFDQHIFSTQWDRDNHWRLVGPMTAEEWQHWKSGVSTLSPRRIFRIKGAQNSKLYLHPTPDAGDAGQTMAFEYLSTQVVRPAAWVASTSYTAGTYVWNDGNIYYTAGSGTSGTTEPTHTSGTVSDGGITWAFYGDSYQTFRADTDTCLLSERVIKLGVKWRFRAARRFDFAEEFRQYQDALSKSKAKLSSAREVSITGRESLNLISSRNLPDSGYGN